MYLTPAQIKGRIKNVAKQNGSDPITLLRIYMMERFLERITYSKYKDAFIVKGWNLGYFYDWYIDAIDYGY